MDCVLIETYWNVKVRRASDRQSASERINRNILECKGVHFSRQVFLDFRINRNILECKDRHRLQHYSHISVLIETYWNVKVLSAGGSGAQTGINRNILECKASRQYRIKSCFLVLIETYWNVKMSNI